MADLAVLLLRVAVGAIFMLHGFDKLVDGGQFIGWIKSLGLPFGEAQAKFAIYSEFVGGLFIILGFASWAPIAFLIPTMGAAIGIAHLKWNPRTTAGGWEYPGLLIVLLSVLALLGNGAYSFDAWLR